MVSKKIMAVVAFAMMAGSAQASMQLEYFIKFADEPNADNFKLMIFYQLWAFFLPLLAGPFNVFTTYLWYDYGTTVTVDTTAVTITTGEAMTFAGIGNYDAMFELLLGILPKFGISQAITFGLLTEAASVDYGDLEKSLIETMGLCDTLACSTCTCA